MASVAEYIFKGKIDLDGAKAEKLLKNLKIQKKELENDEILMRFEYDGNIKSLNKVIDEVTKNFPDLTVQFKYDINKKLLADQLGKMQEIEQIKLDIDTGSTQQKVNQMVSDIHNAIESGVEDTEQLQSRIRDLFRYINTVNKSGGNTYVDAKKLLEFDKALGGYIQNNSLSLNSIKLFDVDESLDKTLENVRANIEETQAVIDDLKKNGAQDRSDFQLGYLEDEIKIINEKINELSQRLDTVSGEAFEELSFQIQDTNQRLETTLSLIDRIQEQIGKKADVDDATNANLALRKIYKGFEEYAKLNPDKNPADYFTELKEKCDAGDESIRTLLKDAKLLNKEGSLSLVEHGYNNYGGIIGEEQVLIARGALSRYKGDMIEYTRELQKRIDAAYESGAKIPRILDIIGQKAEAGTHFFEIQEKIQGEMIANPFEYGKGDTFLNLDFLEATDDQLKELIRTLSILRKFGLGTDLNTSNIYFGENGLTISDLNLEPAKNMVDL